MAFDGWCASRNINPMKLSAASYLALVYYYATKDGDPDSIRKWELRLFMPPKGVVPEEGPWTAEAELSGFRSLARSLNINLVGETPESPPDAVA